VDVDNLAAANPIGVSCRLCPRAQCEQRAFPAAGAPLLVDENVRGLNFYGGAGGGS
jgi:predicted transcriptional regulator